VIKHKNKGMTRHETGNSKQEHQQKTFNTAQRQRAHTTPPPLCVILISLNMGTGDVSVNKWENKVTRYLFEKVTQLFCSKFKNNVLV